MYLIGSIGFSLQSAVTLYIYRVGKPYPVRNPVYRSKSIKNSNYSRIPPRPVRPVGLLPDQLQHQTGQTAWSDQLMPILAVNRVPVLTFQKYKKQHMIHSQKMIISMQLKIIDQCKMLYT